jgi:peptide chain release factor 3
VTADDPAELERFVAMYPFRIAYDVVDALTVLCEYDGELKAMQESRPGLRFHAMREHGGLVIQARVEAA